MNNCLISHLYDDHGCVQLPELYGKSGLALDYKGNQIKAVTEYIEFYTVTYQ
jgi:hypothetical protein